MKVSLHQNQNQIKQNQLSFNLGDSHKTPQCNVGWSCEFCNRKCDSLLLHESKPVQNNNCNDCNVFVGPCHNGMACPQVADGGTASDMEGSSE